MLKGLLKWAVNALNLRLVGRTNNKKTVHDHNEEARADRLRGRRLRAHSPLDDAFIPSLQHAATKRRPIADSAEMPLN